MTATTPLPPGIVRPVLPQIPVARPATAPAGFHSDQRRRSGALQWHRPRRCVPPSAPCPTILPCHAKDGRTATHATLAKIAAHGKLRPRAVCSPLRPAQVLDGGTIDCRMNALELLVVSELLLTSMLHTVFGADWARVKLMPGSPSMRRPRAANYDCWGSASAACSGLSRDHSRPSRARRDGRPVHRGRGAAMANGSTCDQAWPAPRPCADHRAATGDADSCAAHGGEKLA